jgi:hypothetical protein
VCVYIYIYIHTYIHTYTYKNLWALKKVKVAMQSDFMLKKVPREILGSNMAEVKGGWRKLRNEEPKIMPSSA